MLNAQNKKSPYKEGNPRKVRKKNFCSTEYLSIHSSISDHRTTEQEHNTEFSYSPHDLNSLIQKKRLSDALEFLENLGYTGDMAIFVMASLQWQGGAA